MFKSRASSNLSEKEAALIQEALATARKAPPAAAVTNADIEKTLEMTLSSLPPAAAKPMPQPKRTVFAPADMKPELTARIAMLMEQEAEYRQARRDRRRRMVMLASGFAAALVLVLIGLAVSGLSAASSAHPAAAKPAGSAAPAAARD